MLFLGTDYFGDILDYFSKLYTSKQNNAWQKMFKNIVINMLSTLKKICFYIYDLTLFLVLQNIYRIFKKGNGAEKDVTTFTDGSMRRVTNVALG